MKLRVSFDLEQHALLDPKLSMANSVYGFPVCFFDILI